MESCCRICRRMELEKSLSLDFLADTTGETIQYMIFSVTGLMVDKSDGMPYQICLLCMGSLTVAYEMKRLCVESDAYFRKRSPILILPVAVHLVNDTTDTTNQTNADNVEAPSSPLTMEIKIEDETVVEDAIYEAVENHQLPHSPQNNSEQNWNIAVNMMYCCFPNCSVGYPFQELLVEHARRDHRAEREANSLGCPDNCFLCITCGRGFEQEAALLYHRKQPAPIETADAQDSLELHSTAQKDCSEQNVHAVDSSADSNGLIIDLVENDEDDESISVTNADFKALGFTIVCCTNMFLCCLKHCRSSFDTVEQLNKHFENKHWETRTRNAVTSDQAVRCAACFLALSSRHDLQAHQEANDPIFRCKCNGCGEFFNSKKSAYQHACKKVRQNNTVKTKKTTSRKKLSKKALNKKGANEEYVKTSKGYTCLICKKNFTFLSTLTMHRSQSHNRHRINKGPARATEAEVSSALELSCGDNLGDSRHEKSYTCRWCSTTTSDVDHLVNCYLNSKKPRNEAATNRKTKRRKQTTDKISSSSENTRKPSTRRRSAKDEQKKAMEDKEKETAMAKALQIAFKRFQCDVCAEYFEYRFLLDGHKKTHTA
ncbi:zinc finger protein 184-like [Wyeomyia smithii]|uniref:zinc finger protein 184-like n=1 Tax=Wyeomyia smithii TaxID=174621 RepID=UPI002467EFA2|nr:zinc finger protein 184-like [Wyeomyia smithii]